MFMGKEDSKWNDTFLTPFSLKTDPYAEQIISDIIAEKGFIALRNLFTALSNDHSEIIKSTTLHQSVIDYFNTEMSLPVWADQSKIKLAQAVYLRFAPQIALILNFKALPLCYACKNGAMALTATGRLTGADKDPGKIVRRLFETSQMVINVMSPGGFLPAGKGIVTVKKVRLYHAAIRSFLLNQQTEEFKWDVSKYGCPINQEEMAGTLMAFSALVIDGLNKVGAVMTEEEKDAYIHCWNIVGHFIGLDPALFPTSYNDAWNLGIAIINKNKEESNNGKLLTANLLMFSDNFFGDTILTKMLFNAIPQYLITYFINDVSQKIEVDILKIVGANKKINFFNRIKGKIFIKIITLVSQEEDKDAFVRKLFTKTTSKFLQGVINQHLKIYNTPFYIPSSLKESWKMN